MKDKKQKAYCIYTGDLKKDEEITILSYVKTDNIYRERKSELDDFAFDDELRGIRQMRCKDLDNILEDNQRLDTYDDLELLIKYGYAVKREDEDEYGFLLCK